MADLASLRLDFAFSPEMTLRTLSQFNSTNKSVNTSVRFNWIYSPGSDLYIAYDEFGPDNATKLSSYRFASVLLHLRLSLSPFSPILFHTRRQSLPSSR
jgi:hypothetical protein